MSGDGSATIGPVAREHLVELERILGVAWWAFRPRAATIIEATTPGGPVTGVVWPDLGHGVFLVSAGLAVEADVRPDGDELDVWFHSRLADDGPRATKGPVRVRLDELPPWFGEACGADG